MLAFSLKFVLENISVYLRSSTLVIGIAMVTVAMVTVGGGCECVVVLCALVRCEGVVEGGECGVVEGEGVTS